MKTSLKIFALGLVLAGFGMNVNAQVLTNSAEANATATVKKALTIEKTANLSFGTFSGLNQSASTVVVSESDGSRSGTADLLAGGAGAAAAFTITGEADAVVAITLPGGTTNLIDQAVGNSSPNMTIPSSSWKVNVTDIATVTLTLGTKNILVGATLNVAANQPAATYAGTFEVSVNYN